MNNVICAIVRFFRHVKNGYPDPRPWVHDWYVKAEFTRSVSKGEWRRFALANGYKVPLHRKYRGWNKGDRLILPYSVFRERFEYRVPRLEKGYLRIARMQAYTRYKYNKNKKYNT